MNKILQMLMPNTKMILCILIIAIMGWVLSANANFYNIALLIFIFNSVLEIEEKLTKK